MATGSRRNQTLSYLRSRFQAAGIFPDTRHGQNFLIDLNLMRLLVSAAGLEANDVVLEVGTGTGGVTAQVAPQVAHVVTVEIDPQLFQLASESLYDFGNVTMLKQDALKNKNTLSPTVLEEVGKHLSPERNFKLVANLPYNVATPIIGNLLACEYTPQSMTVTIQKELGDRILAEPGSKDYGALSIWIQSQCDAELVRILPPTAFWPRPKVHSAILHMTYRPEKRERIQDLSFFHTFSRAMFFHRRKFLRANLVSAVKGQLEKPDVDRILAELWLDETSRSETLSVEQMIALSDTVQAAIAAKE